MRGMGICVKVEQWNSRVIWAWNCDVNHPLSAELPELFLGFPTFYLAQELTSIWAEGATAEKLLPSFSYIMLETAIKGKKEHKQ